MPCRSLPFVLCVAVATVRAQAPPDTVALPAVGVEATRSAGGVATAPFSVAVVERGEAERTADPGGTLALALRRVPGLVATNRENPAQGERLSVRGLGARAGFGVRGVQVVLDGVPLTLADGQAVVGIADPALVRRAEIVRGPASALWGNASGGVLFLGTVPDADGAAARFVGGADGLVRVEADASGPLGRHRAGAALSHAQADGYRDHSASTVTRGRAFADLQLSPAAALRLVGAVEDAPRLENPGALTADELAESGRQAEARYVTTASGKASRQGQVAATLRADTRAGALTATAYGLARALDNPLPFAYVAVDRRAGGTRLAAERTLGAVTVSVGADAAVQHDVRTNRPNEAGQPGAERLLDQTETVMQAAAFGRLRLALGAVGLPGVAVEGALRGDRVRFAARDRRLDDGDQSGARALGAWSPSVGATVRLGGALVFASVATAFETPTTTELVNRPGGEGGFNADLRPQRTVGVEAGARGATARLLYDVAVYALTVRDGLAASEGEGGRTFYVNRERTDHRGAEALAEWRPARSVVVAATYAWTRVRLGEGSLDVAGEPVGGNRLPGVPAHRASARVEVTWGGAFVAPEVEVATGLWADDANTVQTDALVVVDLAVGHAGLSAGAVRLAPFVRVQNVLGTRAVGSVVANARGGRFFEPAAGRTVAAGLAVRL